MANGVTPLGFVRPRLPEIRLEITDDLVARLRAVGYAGDIETRPDSLFGLLIDTFATRSRSRSGKPRSTSRSARALRAMRSSAPPC